MHNNSLGDAAASRQGIVAQESEDAGHVLDVGSPAPFLPIHDRYLVAIDDCRDIDLSQVEVEPTFADRLTDGLWIGMVALYLGEVWAMEATHPM